MKKIVSSLVLLLLAIFTLASCNNSDDDEKTNQVTVTWVDLTDNQKVLKEDKVEVGSTISSWTPTKDGYVFDKWYATPSKTIEFDFNNEISKDTTIYGNFVLDTFEVDTRNFYILGASSDPSSILYGTNWEIADENKQKLTKSASTTANEYSITLDLYSGDGFQLAINNDFNNQRGYGYIVGDVSEWVNKENSYLSDNSRKANILVKLDGNYTITLVTHPWSDEYDTSDESYEEANKENFNYNVTDTITIVRNGDPINEADNTPLEIRIKGSYITAWGHILEPEYTMTYNEETDLYTYSHEFVAGDYFCFYNMIQEEGEDGEMHFVGLGPININSDKVNRDNSDVEYLDLTQGNIGTLANGTYSFSYDRKIDQVTITYDPTFSGEYVVNDTWYVAGTGVTEPLKSSNFGYGLTDAQKLTKIDDYTYEITMDIAKGDMFQIVGNSSYGYSHSITDLVNPVLDGVEYFYKAEDNIACRINGNYTITLHLDPKSPLGDSVTWVRNGEIIQEFTADYDVYMKKAPDWTLSPRYQTSEGKVEIKAWLDAGIEFCFVYYDLNTPTDEVGSYSNPGITITSQMLGTTGEFNANISNQTGNNNFECLKAGYYTILIDYSEGAPIVDFVGYEEHMTEFTAMIKGPATEYGWDGSNPDDTVSVNGVVEFIVELKGGTGSNYEFGFTLYGDFAGQYGEYIGWANLGTAGNAHDKFSQQANNGNNIVCNESGTYRCVIDRTSGTAVLNIYIVD